MNNKGQTLVVFIILLPIIIAVLGYLTDKCYLLYQEKRQKETTSIVCQYALNDNNTDSKIKQLALENDQNLSKILIRKLDEQVEITLEKEVPSLFGNLLGIPSYLIKTNVKCMK